MIDHVNNLKFQYLVELSKQGARCKEFDRQIREYLLENDVVFGKEPIPFLLMPHFLSPRQQQILSAVVERLSNILNKFTEVYLQEDFWREELQVDALRDELYRIDPGYENPSVICRLDAFLDGYDLKFLEFNSDSPAGIGYTDVLYRGLHRILDLPEVHYQFEEGYDEMLPHLCDVFRDVYARFRVAHERGDAFPEQPTLAILDLRDVPTTGEFRIMHRFFEAAGWKTIIGDPRDLQRGEDGFFTLDGEPVHLVYRRIVLSDVIKHRDTLETFIDGARERAFCMANPFRSVLVGNKKVLAVLLDPRFQKHLTNDELEVIRRTIPWTRILRPGKVTYGDWVISLPDFVSDNRERLVLKPATGYGGKEVYLGAETSQEVWDGVIEAHLHSADFVVQQFIPVPEEMFPLMEGGMLQMKLKKYNINPFALGGKFGGMITRISDASVINVTEGGGLLPSVVGFIRSNIFGVEGVREPHQFGHPTGTAPLPSSTSASTSNTGGGM